MNRPGKIQHKGPCPERDEAGVPCQGTLELANYDRESTSLTYRCVADPSGHVVTLRDRVV